MLVPKGTAKATKESKMDIEMFQEFFLWGFILNMGMLILWFLLIIFAHDWAYRLHSKWYKLSVEDFDKIHYTLGAAFKVLIFAFFLVPYIALRIIS
jgi:hypothetical protein